MHPSSTNPTLTPQGWGVQPVHDHVGGRRPTSDLHDGRVSNALADVGPSLTFGEQL
ncbi:Hypothetical predicted protein [Olea europaea subsp. europaea]|uniref:Uncharacterized protein n=2 Tax=Olea europaea subsp. europaea TaxID=158383 RepID=A0A8S0SK19_OLEEU|nr:Hypothetical predicted protein [Olea europaea subsp. europaea]